MTDAHEFALQLIEHEIGRTLRVVKTTETVPVRASFASLRHTPIRYVESVKARKSQWEYANVFGEQQFIDIPISDIEWTERGIILPQTMWGSYDVAEVTYTCGSPIIPDDIQYVINIVEEQLDGLNSYTAQLLLKSDEIETILARYRR